MLVDALARVVIQIGMSVDGSSMTRMVVALSTARRVIPKLYYSARVGVSDFL